mmetsp:Transcript_15634/g.18833  ORF Transcript_15634/g.18833 Transcript_15634/m.18833 type:complete len:129 (-) Transcript_15634:63-449(-)
MSRHLSANQYERAFNAKHLCNWEVCPERGLETHTKQPPRMGRTEPIVDERGHMLPGQGRKYNGFGEPEAGKVAPPRWPNDRHQGPKKASPCGTMGYKGKITSYLPHNTVPTRTIQHDNYQEYAYSNHS